jgi:hypothetical protein
LASQIQELLTHIDADTEAPEMNRRVDRCTDTNEGVQNCLAHACVYLDLFAGERFWKGGAMLSLLVAAGIGILLDTATLLCPLFAGELIQLSRPTIPALSETGAAQLPFSSLRTIGRSGLLAATSALEREPRIL